MFELHLNNGVITFEDGDRLAEHIYGITNNRMEALRVRELGSNLGSVLSRCVLWDSYDLRGNSFTVIYEKE